MIHWNLSGGIVHRELLLSFIDSLAVPNVSLSVHDGFSGLSWSAGRERGSSILPHTLHTTLEEYQRRNVGFNLLFSNHLLTESDLGSAFGNQLLEKLHDPRNGVVVCDGVLADYVRERFPKYQLIRSVINAYLDEVIYRDTPAIVNYFQELTQRYDRVVVPSELNLRFDVLDQLDKGKLEFLVNNNCLWHCPYAIKHYTQIAQGFKKPVGGVPTRVCLAQAAALGSDRDRTLDHFRKYEALVDASGKPIKQVKLGQKIIIRKSWMKPEEVASMQRQGCTHFKLQGRDSPARDFAETLRAMVIEYGT